jgi:hypothetical protein
VSQIQSLQFNQLPQVVRERLVASLLAETDRASVRWFRGGRDWIWVRPLFAFIAFAVATYIVQWLIHEDSRKDPHYDREVYYGLAGVLLVAVASTIGFVYRMLWKPPPWKWNVQMVCGSYAVWIGRSEVRLIPVAALTAPLITNVFRNGAYQYARLSFCVNGVRLGDHRFTYQLGNQAEAEKLLAEMNLAHRRFEDARLRGDATALAELDPFAHSTLTNKWSETPAGGPTVVSTPAAAYWGGWLAAAVAAVAISFALYASLKAACTANPRCSSRGRR